MKVIPMSAMEILPALLDRSKTQTIRPLWKKVGSLSKEKQRILGVGKIINGQMIHKNTIIEKKPRFKPGEQAQIMWKMRNSPKGSMFCSKCGNEFRYEGGRFKLRFCYICCDWRKPFPKILGTVEITEVFEIEMCYNPNKKIINWKLFEKNETPKDIYQRDGFSEEIEMLNWFHKAYDLSQPRRFAVYRWRWL